MGGEGKQTESSFRRQDFREDRRALEEDGGTDLKFQDRAEQRQALTHLQRLSNAQWNSAGSV
jgi:hypothetical protein